MHFVAYIHTKLYLCTMLTYTCVQFRKKYYFSSRECSYLLKAVTWDEDQYSSKKLLLTIAFLIILLCGVSHLKRIR